ncbi:galactose metabolism- protein [Sorochytrium milnesiophthora]
MGNSPSTPVDADPSAPFADAGDSRRARQHNSAHRQRINTTGAVEHELLSGDEVQRPASAPVPFPSPRLASSTFEGVMSPSVRLQGDEEEQTGLGVLQPDDIVGRRPASVPLKSVHAIAGDSPFVGSPLSYASHYLSNAPRPRSGSVATTATVNSTASTSVSYPHTITYNATSSNASSPRPQQVYAISSFDGWKSPLPLSYSASTNNFFVTLEMPPGTHRIKFLVLDANTGSGDLSSAQVCCSRDLPTAQDEDGSLVNYIEISPAGSTPTPGSSTTTTTASRQATQPQLPHSQLAQTGQLPTPPQPIPFPSLPRTLSAGVDSPISSYTSDIPPITDFSEAIAPPTLPPHLTKVLLNTSKASGNTGAGVDEEQLSVPHRVVLNHLYACSIRDGVMAVAVTSRYRQKYVTTVLYRPVGTAGTAALGSTAGA